MYSRIAWFLLLFEYYFLNPFVGVLLASPLKGLIDPWFLILRYRGRRSGEIYRTPLLYHREHDIIVLFASRSHTEWWKNFQNRNELEVYINGDWFRGIGEVSDSTDEVFNHLTWLFSIPRKITGVLPMKRRPRDKYIRYISGRFVLVKVSLLNE